MTECKPEYQAHDSASYRILLTIFDIDWTLTKPKSGGTFRKTADDWEWLPGRLERLQLMRLNSLVFRFASNQGGVACGFQKAHEILNAFATMTHEIGFPLGHNITHTCFYHPRGSVAEYMDPCEEFRRKPRPGMLLEAMERAGNIKPENTLMVGDLPEDEEAARNAGCHFIWAKDYFGDVGA